MYEAVVYIGDFIISGYFSILSTTSIGIDSDELLHDGALVSLGISDMKGIRKPIDVSWFCL